MTQVGGIGAIASLPEAIRSAAQPCNFAAHEILARCGERPRSMFLVHEGEVRLVRAGPVGELVILQRVRRGWVAEASLFTASYHCDLVAGPLTRCTRVPIRAIRAALAASPEFGREWIVTLSAEVRRLRGACERMGLRGADRRVLHAVLSEGDEGILQISGTMKDWAAELGLTHEALYRTLARMEADGILRREPGRLVLLQGRLPTDEQQQRT